MERVKNILREALGEEGLKSTIFWEGLELEDRKILKEIREEMHDKTLDG